jgi:hypothetical protein
MLIKNIIISHKVFAEGNIQSLKLGDISGIVILKDKIQAYHVDYPQPFDCDISYNELENYIDKSGDLWKNISKS